jgi:hypothetical protein
MLPSSRRTGDSRANSSLGGGSPAYTAAVEKPSEPERHRTPSPPPLKTARVTSPSLASRGSFPPWYVGKLDSSYRVDRVGGNIITNGAP